ncbi:MAG: hypothetical protein GVY11_05785 [Gammaproteobacteria bacterium]|jgi:hypothetical protein|nr:hypothetical protein [Gammaproteobacteria bacterium]
MSKFSILIAIAAVLAIGGLGLWAWDALIERDGETEYFSLVAGLAGVFALIAAVRSKSSSR